MLTALRRLAGTWTAKVLFALLILSFAVWGIGDMAAGFGRDTAVARVGRQPSDAEEAPAAARGGTQPLPGPPGGQFEADPPGPLALGPSALVPWVLARGCEAV